jgi:hypothetical protein
MSRHHQFPQKSIRIAHASSGPQSIPSVFPVKKQRKRPWRDILQGEIRKIKPPTFNGEHSNREEGEAWLNGNEDIFPIA